MIFSNNFSYKGRENAKARKDGEKGSDQASKTIDYHQRNKRLGPSNKKFQSVQCIIFFTSIVAQ